MGRACSGCGGFRGVISPTKSGAGTSKKDGSGSSPPQTSLAPSERACPRPTSNAISVSPPPSIAAALVDRECISTECTLSLASLSLPLPSLRCSETLVWVARDGLVLLSGVWADSSSSSSGTSRDLFRALGVEETCPSPSWRGGPMGGMRRGRPSGEGESWGRTLFADCFFLFVDVAPC